MKKMQSSALGRYIRENLPLLLAAAAALALFSKRSRIMLLLEAAVFGAVALICWLEKEQNVQPPVPLAAAVPAALFSAVGAVNFSMTWKASWSLLGGILLGVLAFYAFYRLCGRLDRALRGTGNLEALTIRKNFWMPLAAGVFFLLCARGEMTSDFLLGIPAAMAVWWILACRVPSLSDQLKRGGKCLWTLAGLAAVGICLFQWEGWRDTAPVLAGLGAVVSLPLMWLAVGALYRLLWNILSQALEGISRTERYVYGFAALAMAAGMAFLFLRTDAFYGISHLAGSEDLYDVVYTADSPLLVSENAYLWLNCGQNDLRQPLFAVFAAPLIAPFYLLGKVLSADPGWMAILLNVPQVMALLLGCLLLTRSLGLSGRLRNLFLGLCVLSYPVLLFSVMMEQYVIGFFYLMTLVFGCCRNRRDPVCFWAVGGTLLTGLVLAPLMTVSDPRRDWKRWLAELVDVAVGFVVAMTAFCRLDILLGAVESLLGLSRFSGEVLTFGEKLRQYTVFLSGCLFAPEAEAMVNPWGFLSWQLPMPTGFSLLGIGVFLLAVLGAVLRWDQKISRISLGFLGLSVFVLLVMGWGTQENGLILYALYFGWAIMTLLWQLCTALGKRTGKAWAGAVPMALLLMCMLLRNLPEMGRLIQFALNAYGL